MLHIILIILKIIGLLLLGVLGIALFILLLLLFAPFRYSVDGKKRGEVCFHAKLTWVCFFLRVVCSYEKEKLIYYVKIFGYPLISNEEKKKRKKKGKKREEKKKKKEKPLSEEEQLLLAEIEEEAKLQKIELERMKEQEEAREKAAGHRKIEESKDETIEPLKEKTTEERKSDSSKEESEKWDKTKEKKKIQKEKIEPKIGEEEKLEASEEKTRKNPIVLLRRIFCKIKEIICKILEKIGRFFHRLDELGERINQVFEKLREWMEFINEEMTRKALSKTIKIAKKLLKHILPRKIRGNLAFGLEDPAIMGQILAILGMAMPLYKDSLEVEPHFGVNMLEGEIKAKGKICLGYLLYLAVIVLIDKDIMGTIKKARSMARNDKESEGGE